VGVLGASSAAWPSSFIGDRNKRGGFVIPCSLVGVNPVHHPEVFDDPAAAAYRDYGFLRRGKSFLFTHGCFLLEPVSQLPVSANIEASSLRPSAQPGTGEPPLADQEPPQGRLGRGIDAASGHPCQATHGKSTKSGMTAPHARVGPPGLFCGPSAVMSCNQSARRTFDAQHIELAD
jgi:hypothetical protein